jgi:hypothetical protein
MIVGRLPAHVIDKGIRTTGLLASVLVAIELMRRYRKERPYDRNNKHDQEEQ